VKQANVALEGPEIDLLKTPADHGGNLDAACALYGGPRSAWVDLSTGINPVPYRVGALSGASWTDLPDARAEAGLIDAARAFWEVPDGLDILPTHGASASIAAVPGLFAGQAVHIPGPTYNEHARAFAAAGWTVTDDESSAQVRVLVHPNNPDGRRWSANALDERPTIIDESFADCHPGASLLPLITPSHHLILKSFGKFWGLAGLRLGFVIGAPDLIAPLRARLGPWSVSGPALEIGARALRDVDWARETRARLAEDSQRLDALASRHGLGVVGGTSLFRLYHCPDAGAVQSHLAQHRIWSRTFPYSAHWLRLGLPAPDHWPRLEAAFSG
jgi:cobalamin biosynthetic protein CobC